MAAMDNLRVGILLLVNVHRQPTKLLRRNICPHQ